MKNNKTNKIIYISSFIIPLIVSFIGLIIGQLAPFGNHNILSTGNHNDLLPLLYEYYDHFHDGESLFWSNLNGLGYDFSTFISYYFSDPTNIIILLFPRNSIIIAINLLYIFKIGLAGLSMSIYLNYKKRFVSIPSNNETDPKNPHKKNDFLIGFKSEPKSKIMSFIVSFDWIIISISCIFALSLTMITTGSIVMLLTSISIFPLIMMELDKLIMEKRFSRFCLVLATSIICNIHISIISIVFILLYFATRRFDNTHHLLVSVKYFIASIVLAIFLSSIVIIPSIKGQFFLNDTSMNFPVFTFKNIFNSINQLTSKTSVSYYSLYGNHTDIAFGIGILFLAIIYFYCKAFDIKTRIRNLCLLIFIFIGTCSSTVKYLLNGFNLSVANDIHFGYILVFFCCMLGYEVICVLSTVKTKTIVKSVITVSVLFASGLVLSDMFENISIYTSTFKYIFIYFLIMLIFTNKSMTKSLTIIVISTLIIVESITGFITNFNKAGNGYLSQSLEKINEYQLYEINRNIHLKNKNASILSYNSEDESILPTKYLFSGYDFIITQGFLNYDNKLLNDNTNIYNPNQKYRANIAKILYSTNGCLYDTNIKEYSFDEKQPFSSSNIFTNHYLKSEDIFTSTEVDYSLMESSDNMYFNASVIPYDNGDLYIFLNDTYNIGEVKPGQEYQAIFKKVPYSYPLDDPSYQSALLKDNSLVEILKNRTIPNNNIRSELLETHKSNIAASSDGYVSTGFPYLKTYTYKVNNKIVKPISLFDNNTLLPISTGKNTIEIKYSSKTIIEIIMMTIIGILFFIFIKKEQNNETEI